MNIQTVDFETFWSPTHSLTKMNPIEYVMHPDTELISVSLKTDDAPTRCVFGEQNIRALLNTVNWDQALATAHNMSGFDALILAWRLGIKPRIWNCTLAMARPIHAKTTGLSLAKLVAHYNLGVKDNSALINTRGKHLKDFTQYELANMAKYNCDDSDQCYALFKVLRPHYSVEELWHLDCKIRGIAEPEFMLDVPLLQDALRQEKINKRRVLLDLAAMFQSQVMPVGDMEEAGEDYIVERVRATLASAPMFSEVLKARGVAVPMKQSTTNADVMIPALAKDDVGFLALLEHEDELVAMAAASRLSVKSTIAETRLQAFIDVAQHTNDRWPVTVNYCGADTTGRASGWLYNPLNMNKIGKTAKPSDALRMSIMAPPGYKVVAVDASGIEMRFNHFLWNVRYSTELWKKDATADIYKPTAAAFYGCTVEEVDKAMRQTGKVQQLACGFGCGGDRYVDMARTMGGIILLPEEAHAQVSGWRDMTPEIADYKEGGWRRCADALESIMNGIERPIDPRGIFWTCAEGVRLPSGRIIRYPALRQELAKRKRKNHEGDLVTVDEWTWMYGEKRHKTFIHGPKADENLVQAGARDYVYDVAIDIFKMTGYRPKLEVYDELVYIVPEDKAEAHLALVQQRFREPPSWFPDLVTWSEGDIADRYGEAK